MKTANILCPHCNKSFNLFAVLTTEGQRALEQQFFAQRDKDPADSVIKSWSLELMEKEKIIAGLRKSIRELQVQSMRGSQQGAGEVLEQKVFDELCRNFPDDEITRVGRGKNGGDIIQRVRDHARREIGKILWEVKNTVAWSSKWTRKIRDDALKCGAQLSVIVTNTLPNGLSVFGQIDETWVAGIESYIGLGVAVRSQILACAKLRGDSGDDWQLAGRVCQYFRSSEFEQRVKLIITAIKTIDDQIDREKVALDRHWDERQKLTATVSNNLTAVFGRIEQLLPHVAEPSDSAVNQIAVR